MSQKHLPSRDPRALRTRAKLEQALMEIAARRGFPAATVQEVSRRAQVSRSTFYRHFRNTRELLDKVFADLQEQGARQPIRSVVVDQRQLPIEAPPSLVVLIRQIQKRAPFFRTMLGPQADPDLTKRLRWLLEQQLQRVILLTDGRHLVSENDDALALRYVCFAVIGVLAWWLQAGQPISVEDLAIAISRCNLAALRDPVEATQRWPRIAGASSSPILPGLASRN